MSDGHKSPHGMALCALLDTYLTAWSRGAEIGVRQGNTSDVLLKYNKHLDLVLVDPYLPYHDVGTDFTQEKQDEEFKRAVENLCVYGPRARWCHKLSVEAAVDYPTEYFDFVFIDAEHTYDACKADIQAWWPKVRLGGLLCGHDYSMADVNKAVNEMFPGSVKALPYPFEVWWVVR